jgi:hypothetical protein
VWRAARAALVRLMVLCLVLQGMVAVSHIHADASEPGLVISGLFWADHHEGPEGSSGHDRHKNQKSEKNCPACLAASMGAHALLDVATPALPLPQSRCQAEQYAASSLEAVDRLASPIRAPPFQMNA